MRPLGPHAFNQRLASVVARLDDLGVLQVQDQGERRGLRKVAVEVLAPGQRDILELPDEARFLYEEWFRRVAGGAWVRVRYHYNYFDLVTGGWRGYHLHALAGSVEPIPHAKCVLPDGTGGGRHYAAYEVELLAAHDEFELQYAAGRPIDCRGMRAID